MKKIYSYLFYIFYKVYRRWGNYHLLISNILKKYFHPFLTVFSYSKDQSWMSSTRQLLDKQETLNQDQFSLHSKNASEQSLDDELIAFYQKSSGRKDVYSRKNPQQILKPSSLSDYLVGGYLIEDE